MEFDIIEIDEETLKSYTAVQMQLLRSAQKNKNKLERSMEEDLELFQRLVLTDDMKDSSLIEQKREELEEKFKYEVEIIREQLLYSLQVNSPLPDDTDISEVGYIVDYTLSYVDRYNIVRAYYLSIEDPAERMALYGADEVAKDYLASYYRVLYDVLTTYSK